MMQATVLVGLIGIVTLTACSKSPEDVVVAPAPVPETTVTAPAPAQHMPDAAPQKSLPEQASTLASYLDTRSDCDPVRTQLEQAGKATPDATTPATDLTAIMEKAKVAGCFKQP